MVLFMYIRWDLLYLINRAHKDARGKAIYDQEIQIELEEKELADDEEFTDTDIVSANQSHTERCKASVSELIDFIQVFFLKCTQLNNTLTQIHINVFLCIDIIILIFIEYSYSHYCTFVFN